jgi:hypothetical protein
MASPKPHVVDFPDLPPKNKGEARRALMGKEIGTQFLDWGQRLFAYYGDGDVFLAVRLRRMGRA